MRLLLAMACAAAGSFAQDMLTSVDGLAAKLGDPALVILHVGAKQDYDAGHIPGARLVTLADISMTGERGLRLELPAPEVLRGALMKLGVGDSSKVVIYTGTDSIQSATRVWFTLDYLSLKAALLDGGLAAWKAASKPLSTEAAVFMPAAKLNIQPRPELVVDAAWVAQHKADPKLALLDARLPEFYTGANAGQMPRAGHIPGARNVPFPSLLDENKKLLAAEKIAQGLGPGDTLVTYCHIGQQATVLYFAARLTGRSVKLYDGSYQDWSARTELPVAGAAIPKQ